MPGSCDITFLSFVSFIIRLVFVTSSCSSCHWWHLPVMSPINMKSCCSSIVFGYVVHPEMYGFSQQTTAILGGTVVKRWNDETMWKNEIFRNGELHWGGGSFHRGRHRATLPRRRAHCCGCFQTGWALRSNYLLKWDGSRFDVQYILEIKINKKVKSWNCCRCSPTVGTFASRSVWKPSVA